ncbi:outer membrane protein [Rhodalgimonas zhirmunskyi]|uniref:Outer membrane beta-barrel protein n=1 Tax=Rhodalgimonas zhirmunskyi TaxID=2964767 RepID=A0AAJ1X661_9RHOB|nr:outer membrane beta-barrel protein [Rhodoalgimonas zhirmunskyi]MDQ2094389.1 outer membrane beta-barrel protein [Rhodoalgimonas zhirmunskyi]
MKLKALALASVAASAIALPAFAGSPVPADPDPVVPAPVVPVAVSGDWTGAYGGLSLGYADVSTTGASDTNAIYGLSMGYDYDMGNWVLGGGLDYDWTDINLGAANVDNVARLKLRAGYDMGNGLLYGTGGVAKAYSSIGDDNGWFAGVGYEHMLTQNVSLGGEVLYHQFDNFAGTGNDIDATTIALKTNFRF